MSSLQFCFAAAFSLWTECLKQKLKAREDHVMPERTTKYGCCWFRSKLCPDLTFQSFFQEFIEYVHLPFSYFRRHGFICLKHYPEILAIIPKMSLPLPLKSLSSFVLESSKYVTTPSHVPLLRKDSCEIYCEASC